MGDLSEPVDLGLAEYRQMIERYMRYVLIASTKYVDTKAEAVYIALYTFASTYAIINKFDIADRIGLVLDVMVDVVGDDVVKNARAGRQAQGYGITGPVLEDKKVRKIAKALNAIDGFSRLVLVLYFIENISSEAIAFLYPGKSISEIETSIILAAKQFVEQLAEFLPFSLGSVLRGRNYLGRPQTLGRY